MRSGGNRESDGNKTERVVLRVTKEEKERLQLAAVSAGLTITAYLLGDKLGQMILEGWDKSK